MSTIMIMIIIHC